MHSSPMLRPTRRWTKASKVRPLIYDFDQSFTPYYIGKRVVGSFEDNLYFYQTAGGIGAARKTGQQDFKEKYLDADYPRDSDDPQSDQAHHFVAYFSAGINGAFFSTSAHKATEGALYRSASSIYNGGRPKWANKGDILLGDDAYNFGAEVRNNTQLLNNIGSEIMRRFCN